MCLRGGINYNWWWYHLLLKGETNGRWKTLWQPKVFDSITHWRHNFFFNCIMATDKSWVFFFIGASKTFNIHYICQKSQCLTFHFAYIDSSQYLSLFFCSQFFHKQQYHIHFYYFAFEINSVNCIKLKGMLSSFINWLSPRK